MVSTRYLRYVYIYDFHDIYAMCAYIWVDCNVQYKNVFLCIYGDI